MNRRYPPQPEELTGLTIVDTVDQFKKERKEAINETWVQESSQSFEDLMPQEHVSAIANSKQLKKESSAINFAHRLYSEIE